MFISTCYVSTNNISLKNDDSILKLQLTSSVNYCTVVWVIMYKWIKSRRLSQLEDIENQHSEWNCTNNRSAFYDKMFGIPRSIICMKTVDFFPGNCRVMTYFCCCCCNNYSGKLHYKQEQIFMIRFNFPTVRRDWN